jgi:trans-aconitate methyltransferase
LTSSPLVTAPAVVAGHLPVSDPALYLSLYERALIDLWPHLSFAGDRPLRRICDLGCGQGIMSDALSATFPEARVTGFGASRQGMDKARSLSSRPQWIEAGNEDWPRLLTSEGPFDLIICHNGWPLSWTLEDGLERLIEVTARGGTLLLHLDLSLYEAFEPRFAQLNDLAVVYQRLGHLVATPDQLDIWRTDYAPALKDMASLEGLIDGFSLHADTDSNRVPPLARLKAQMTPQGRLISRHLFIKLTL